MQTLGDRIRKLRTEKRWTQDVLAEKARISTSFLSDVENNNRSIGADRLLDIARMLSVSVDYLLQGGELSTAEAQILIPPRLAQFAKEKQLPFNQILTLLDMRRQIIAHRSTTKSENPDDFDWGRFYKSVKEFLP
jgi:transcriptional regulator with XRE-family HTH domain